MAGRLLGSDDQFAVLDKPLGLPCHPGRADAGAGSVEDWFPFLSRRRTGPWLAHRLDRDTSGCLVVALRLAALHRAQAAFARGKVRKTYWAVCDGVPAGAAGRIEAGLSRHEDARGWRMRAGTGGDAASSEWRLLGHDGARSAIEVLPRTGRTHQVRAHLAWLGCPIAGDPIYGTGRGPLQLLARAIALAGEFDATAPLPPHMAAWRDMASA